MGTELNKYYHKPATVIREQVYALSNIGLFPLNVRRSVRGPGKLGGKTHLFSKN